MEFFCNAKTYRVAEAENAVNFAVLQAILHPEWYEVALETYRLAKSIPQEVVDFRAEAQSIERTLEQVQTEQQAAIKAQISGIMQGASPDAYAEVFAGIAARRKGLEDRRGFLKRAAQGQKTGQKSVTEDSKIETVLNDVHKALVSEFVTETEKRDLIAKIIDRVICQKEGADVWFAPGLFGEVCADSNETLQTVKIVTTADLLFLAYWNLVYHTGQINYLQTMLGDTEQRV